MFRTEKTVGMLKSIAMIAGLAILLWSLGLPSIRFSEASNVTSFSDTISDSAPGASSDHTVDFTVPAGPGVANGEDIVLDFSDGPFGLSGIGAEDIDLFVNLADFGAANWSVATTATTITITIDTGSIVATDDVSIRIGDNAVGVTSDSQLVNPSAEGSYEIIVTSGSVDTGSTRVVILTAVTVTAAVDTLLTFTVNGVAAGGTVNGETITGTTGSTSIPFGTLTNGNASTSAQALAVTTNASNGYVVTVQLDQSLLSSTGADIDGFNGDSNAPAPWAAPAATLGAENTYGHWGLTTDDASITSRSGDEFASQEFIAASTTPRDVMSHTGPVNGIGMGQGTTTVGYKIEISALQEAGDDYTATLTYVVTPTF